MTEPTSRNTPTLRWLTLAYLAVGLLCGLFDVSSLATDILFAPFFILIPLGCGLTLFTLFRLTRHELFTQQPVLKFIVAYFSGVIVVTCWYYNLENLGWLQAAFTPIALGVLAFCVLGLLLQKQSLTQASKRCAQTLWTPETGILLFVFFALYYHDNGQFSAYPLRDLFQNVHFLKGAIELSEHHFINPYNANSYIPFLQVHWGLLDYLFNVNLVRLQWIIPWIVCTVHFTCLYYFFQTFTHNPRRSILAIAVVLPLMTFCLSPANNDLLVALTAAFLALTFRMFQAAKRPVETLLYLLTPLVTLFFLRITTTDVLFKFSHYLYVVLALFALLSLSRRRGSIHLLVLVLITCLGHSLHRAIFMFFPMAMVLAWLSAKTVDQNKTASRRQYLWAKRLTWALMGVFFLAMSLGFGLLLEKIQIPEKAFTHFAAFFSLVFDKSLRSPVDFAFGYTNTFLEFVRSAPVFIWGACFTLLIRFFAIDFALRMHGKTFFNYWSGRYTTRLFPKTLNLVFFCLIPVLLTILAVFSGIPFTYRGQFFIVLFMSLLMVELIHMKTPLLPRFTPSRFFCASTGFFALFFSFLISKYYYNFQWSHEKIANPYLRELFPLNYIGLWLILVVAGLLVVASNRKQRVLLLSVLVPIGILQDRISIRTKYFNYSYGSDEYDGRPIAHYTLEEIELAQRLKQLRPRAIVLSDPFTTSTIKGFAGLQGLYSIQSIAHLETDLELKMRSLLQQLFPGKEPSVISPHEHQKLFYAGAAEFLTLYPGSTFEAQYAKTKTVNEKIDLAQLADDIVIVVSKRTHQWLENQASYFPDHGAIESSHIDFIDKNFQIIEQLKNEFLIVAFPQAPPAPDAQPKDQ